MPKRCRHWCFTVNNFTDEDISMLCGREGELFNYLVFQRELGESGTPHLQGYMELKKAKTLKTIKNSFLPKGHLEPRGGPRDSARDYCMKEDSRMPDSEPYEFGEWKQSAQGRRSDLDAVAEKIQSGEDFQSIIEEFPKQYIRYGGGMERLRAAITPPRDWKTEVIVLYGPTGTGKSKWARDNYEDAFWKRRDHGNSVWWDGYAEHETVIIDEFYGWMPYDYMLRLLDRYPMRVDIKGGTAQFVAKTIVLTSNDHPMNWFPKITKDKSPLYRRIDKIYSLPKLGEIEEEDFEY